MNPFSLQYNPAYFCDRKEEISKLKENLHNGLNTFVHSPRRLGKTALIHHLFYSLKKEAKIDCIYIDLFATQNMADLIALLAQQIVQEYHKKNILKGIADVLKGISPTISFSSDGTPKISIDMKEPQYTQSLGDLFAYLEKQKRMVVVAFDEFQEIASYPEKAEATLRTYVQQLKNVRFIYSGSSSHLLKNMFYSAKRPFYQSSEVLVLNKLDRETFSKFIYDSFKKNNVNIHMDAIEYIIDFSEGYTYYTLICANQCFSKAQNNTLGAHDVRQILNEYIESRKADYQQVYSLLPVNQRKVVVAVSKEGEVEKPTAFDFLLKYNLPVGSSTLLATNKLIDKEVLYNNMGKIVTYDIFFKRFLRKYY